MNITKKIIVTDTNIITDLFNCKLLDDFIVLDNVYVSDIVKRDEFNEKTASFEIISKIKCLELSENDLEEVMKLRINNQKLSSYDLASYVIAKKHGALLATGDNKLRQFSIENGLEVIRTLKIIELLYLKNVISKEKLLEALDLLINNDKTRIPKNEILKLKNSYLEKIVA